MARRAMTFDEWLDEQLAEIDGQIDEYLADFPAWYARIEAEGFFNIDEIMSELSPMKPRKGGGIRKATRRRIALAQQAQEAQRTHKAHRTAQRRKDDRRPAAPSTTP